MVQFADEEETVNTEQVDQVDQQGLTGEEEGEEVGEEVEDDPYMALKAKWELICIIEDEDEAEEYHKGLSIASGGLGWAPRRGGRAAKTTGIVTQSFYCKGYGRSKKCRAESMIKYGEAIEIWTNGIEHRHNLPTTRGLPLTVKSAIDKVFEEGVSCL